MPILFPFDLSAVLSALLPEMGGDSLANVGPSGHQEANSSMSLGKPAHLSAPWALQHWRLANEASGGVHLCLALLGAAYRHYI